MKFTRLLTLTTLLAIVAVIAIAYAQEVSITVKVIDTNGNLVEGAVVYAYQGKEKVAECTTTSDGVCKMSIENKTTTFVVNLGSARYAIKTVSTYLPATVEVDLRTMNKVELQTNTSYNIPVTVEVLATETELKDMFKTNCTIYASESINVTYPDEYRVGVLKIVKFKKLKYDSTETTDRVVTLTLSSSNYTVVGLYEVKIVVETNMLILVGVLVLIIVIVLLMAMLKKRRIAVRIIHGTYI